jgi:tetratricopeptide (TPR) repeat protein
MISVLLLLLLGLAQNAPPTPASSHEAALGLYKAHHYVEAAGAFRKALESEKPGSVERGESVLLLGQCLYLSGDLAGAIPYLSQSPPTDEVDYMLANAYQRLRDLKGSEAAVAKLYGVGSSTAAAHLITAQMLMRNDMDDEAATELKLALDLDPKLPQVHYILGEIALFHGSTEQAISYLKEEAALNPNFAMVYYKLGDAYSRLPDWPNAIAYLQKSVWLNPDFSGPYILLGKAFQKTRRFADAEGILRHAIQLDPNNYSAHYLLGQTLMQEGKTEEGRQMLEQYQKLKQ